MVTHGRQYLGVLSREYTFHHTEGAGTVSLQGGESGQYIQKYLSKEIASSPSCQRQHQQLRESINAALDVNSCSCRRQQLQMQISTVVAANVNSSSCRLQQQQLQTSIVPTADVHNLRCRRQQLQVQTSTVEAEGVQLEDNKLVHFCCESSNSEDVSTLPSNECNSFLLRNFRTSSCSSCIFIHFGNTVALCAIVSL